MNLPFYGGEKIRKVQDKKTGTWYYSVVDVIEFVTESKNPRGYWKVLKNRLQSVTGSRELVTECYQLKIEAQDGKMRLSDMADQETIFRLIGHIPSKKVRNFFE